MATLLFIITCGVGLFLSATFYRKKKSQGDLSGHQHALILATGIGITVLISSYAPLLASAKGASRELSIILLLLGNSILAFLLVYIIVRTALSIRKKKENQS